METKYEKFIRLAESRVPKATKAIRSIGNLSSSSYEYNEGEVEKMFAALQEELDVARRRFTRKRRRERFSFS